MVLIFKAVWKKLWQLQLKKEFVRIISVQFILVPNSCLKCFRLFYCGAVFQLRGIILHLRAVEPLVLISTHSVLLPILQWTLLIIQIFQLILHYRKIVVKMSHHHCHGEISIILTYKLCSFGKFSIENFQKFNRKEIF